MTCSPQRITTPYAVSQPLPTIPKDCRGEHQRISEAPSQEHRLLRNTRRSLCAWLFSTIPESVSKRWSLTRRDPAQRKPDHLPHKNAYNCITDTRSARHYMCRGIQPALFAPQAAGLILLASNLKSSVAQSRCLWLKTDSQELLATQCFRPYM